MKIKVWAIIMVLALVGAGMPATVLAALAQAGSVLVSSVQVEGLVPLTDDSALNDGYFHSSMTEDGILSIVNCCAAREDGANVAAPAFREAFAAMVSE